MILVSYDFYRNVVLNILAYKTYDPTCTDCRTEDRLADDNETSIKIPDGGLTETVIARIVIVIYDF